MARGKPRWDGSIMKLVFIHGAPRGWEALCIG
jgi:hypothetical protein